MKNKRHLLKLSNALGELSQKLSRAYFCASEINKFHKQRLRKMSLAPLSGEATDLDRQAWAHCEAIRKLFDTDKSIFEQGIELVIEGVEQRIFTGNWHLEEYSVNILINAKGIQVQCLNGYVSVDDQNRERYSDFERITINGTVIEDELSGDLAATSIINSFFTSQLLEPAFDFGDDMNSAENELDEEQIKALMGLLSIS